MDSFALRSDAKVADVKAADGKAAPAEPTGPLSAASVEAAPMTTAR